MNLQVLAVVRAEVLIEVTETLATLVVKVETEADVKLESAQVQNELHDNTYWQEQPL